TGVCSEKAGGVPPEGTPHIRSIRRGKKIKEYAGAHKKTGNGKIKFENLPDWSQEGFQRFWDEYPRPEDYEYCRGLWATLNPNEELVEKIVAAVREQKSNPLTKLGGDPQYCPFPKAFLKEKKWNDPVKPYHHPAESLPGSFKQDQNRGSVDDDLPFG
ncbi:MAG TPA: hypothetical protein PLQ35_17385, partial [bacterium]|nr:hypothetical protein [bacterium]